MKTAMEADRRRYEPEIDGLRAVAVLLVVLFHTGFKGWRGGFVGVDIFFVISGYLISRNILDDLRAGRFRFADFYFRRARRIFPAMFVVMAATTFAAFFILSPVDLRAFGQSVLASSVAVQNILFWREAGYWDTAASHKPLLHFWSLAVEEQFYLVWPALLVFAVSFSKRQKRAGGYAENRVLWVIVLVSLFSLLASQFILGHDRMAAFYLTPFRGFEFGLGALVLYTPRLPERWRTFVLETAFGAGITMIAASVRLYTNDTPFPGFAALLPCIGAALVIAGREARFSGWLLRNRVAVGIGLMSYSLYLVHWPLIVFFKYYHLQEPTRLQRYALVAVALVLAAINYRLVEQPFRRLKTIGRLNVRPAGFYGAMIVLLLLLCVPATWAWLSPGAVRGMTPELLTVMSHLQQGHAERTAFLRDCAEPQTGACHRPDATAHYAVLGDSFGEDFGMALLQVRPQAAVTLFAHGGCKALVDPGDEGRLSPDCRTFAQGVLDPRKDWSGYDAVFLGMAWDAGNIALIPATARFLKAHGARRVIVVGPRVRLREDPLQLLMRCKTLADYAALSAREMDRAAQSKLAAAAKAAATAGGGEYLDLAGAECPGAACPNLVPGTLQPMLWDPGHFTLAGGVYVIGNSLNAFALK